MAITLTKLHGLQGVLADVRQSRYAFSFVLRLFALLSVYWWLERNLNGAARMPHEAYEQTFILWQCIQHDTPEALLFLLAPLIALSTRAGRRGWASIGNGRPTKVLVMATVVTLAWSFSTYSYNHYFDQSHQWDRILLIVLAAGCWFHPAVVFPFLLQTMSIAAQFHHPIGQFSWNDKILPLRVLMLFAASLVTLLIWRRRVSRDFALAAACAVAAHYFVPGLMKVELRWWELNHLHFLTAGAYANGWLGFLDTEMVHAIIEFIRNHNKLGICLTLLVEVGAVLFLAHRRLALSLLCGWIVLHVGILFASGICFWKWIVLDAFFLVFLWLSPKGMQRWLFAPPRFATSILLISMGSWFFAPAKLAWCDTCVSYTFDFSGRGENGVLYEISKEAIAPYDFYFSQNRLVFLTTRKLLTQTYGTTQDPLILQRLSSPPRSAREILELESRYGKSAYDQAKTELCVQFLKRFFSSWNRRLDQSGRSPFRAPLHIWTHNPADAYHGQEPLSAVRIYLTTWLYDPRDGLVPVSRQLLQEISLEPTEYTPSTPTPLYAEGPHDDQPTKIPTRQTLVEPRVAQDSSSDHR